MNDTAPTTLREYFLGGGVRFPSRYRAVEVLGVAAYAWVTLLILGQLVRGVAAHPLVLWLVVPTALLAQLCSDFVSGFVHFLADTYATATTPFVGPKFVQPFREHHVDPLAITRHDFVEANGDNCIVAQITLLPTYLFLPMAESEWGATAGVFALTFSLSVLLTSVAHGWAHAAHPPRVARALQRWGLILSPEHHAEHHRPPFDRRYCITTGWMNPALDRVHFFRRVETVLGWVGIRPTQAEHAG